MRTTMFALLMAGLSLAGCSRLTSSQKVESPTKTGYHAVFLQNNLVVFGKLSGLGTEYPMLEDVYYVRSNMNPETKEVSNVLVKRGNEWHSPDRMVINAEHIIFVEPVGEKSRVIDLIGGMKAVGK